MMDAALSLALTYAECLTMHYEALQQIMHRFPDEKKHIRKAAVKIAVTRGVMLEAKKRGAFDFKSCVLDLGSTDPVASTGECGATETVYLLHTMNRTENLV